MTIRIKRAYEPASSRDGERILVERLWPRGVSKDELKLAEWMKNVAPTTDLRKWFNHEEDKWPEFRKRYYKELKQQPEAVAELRKKARGHTVTLIYSARNTEYNNAVALKAYLEGRSH